MKALSIRQPWVWAIMHAGKRVENRTWHCSYRGPILLHASKWWDGYEVLETMRADIVPLGKQAGLTMPSVTLPQMQASCGHILARAEVVDCIRPGGTPPAGQGGWYMGEFGIVLANVEPLATPVPFRGALGLFDVPDSVLAPRVDLDCNEVDQPLFPDQVTP